MYSFVCVHTSVCVCVRERCVFLCDFILFMFTYPHHDQDAEQLHHPKGPSYCCSTTTLTSPPLALVSNNYQNVLYFCNFVISRDCINGFMQASNHLRLAFLSLIIMPLRFIQVVMSVDNFIIWLMLSSNPLYGCTSICFISSYWKTSGLFPVFVYY